LRSAKHFAQRAKRSLLEPIFDFGWQLDDDPSFTP
jgi:hypothetical protein